ncbi:hypothetical protein EC957_009518, partial [Mortierella hygrophila]
VGDITVSQYNSRYGEEGGDEITIIVNARGSSGEIARAVTLGTITNPDDSSLEANVYLSLYDWDRDRALRRGCVNTDVHIIFPQNMTHFDSFKVHNRNKGDVRFNLGEPDYRGTPRASGPADANVVMDRLDVKTNDGRVFFTNAVVKEYLKVVAAQGSISGQITVDKQVEIESKEHTHLSVFSSSTDLDLKVSAETRAAVSVKSGFFGHVALKSWSKLYLPSMGADDNKFVRQGRTSQTLTGYFPYPNGTEPTTYLPRIEVSGERADFVLQR